MALFPRRIVQRELDLFREHGLPDQHLKHFIGRLNSATRHALAAEWEVLLLGAFARHADVDYEPDIGKGRPDLVAKIATANGTLELIADIVTVSDFGTHERNPVSYLFEKTWDLALRLGVDYSRFSVEIGDNMRGPKIPRGRVQLLLPSKNRINAFVIGSIRPLLLQVKNSPAARHELLWLEPGVNCRFVYDPLRTSSKSHLSPTVAYSTTNNPLYKSLLRKAKRLREIRLGGLQGVIAVDGDCYSIRCSPYGGPGTYDARAIVRHFLLTHPWITFVTTTYYDDRTGWSGPRKQEFFHTIHWQADLPAATKEPVDRFLRAGLSELPLPLSSPNNALRDISARKELSRYDGLGAWKWSPPVKLSIPVRVFLPLLAGTLTERDFRILFDDTNRFPSPIILFFSDVLRSNVPIKSVSVERCAEEDTDWITFHVGSVSASLQPSATTGELTLEIPLPAIVSYIAGLDHAMTSGRPNYSFGAVLSETDRIFISAMLSQGRLLSTAHLVRDGTVIRLVFGPRDAAISEYA